jgi:hypothetical protein
MTSVKGARAEAERTGIEEKESTNPLNSLYEVIQKHIIDAYA